MNLQTEALKDILTIDNIVNFYNNNGYMLCDGQNNNYHPVNIINIRNSNRYAGKFDDTQLLLFYINGNPYFKFYDVTVDPSRHYLLNPMNIKGTAIVMPGQYIDGWKLGLHKGKYEALVQHANITVIRDLNNDDILDIPVGGKYSSLLLSETKNKSLYKLYHSDGNTYYAEHGKFGINCHRASSWKILDTIGLYGAGCTVHQDPVAYLDFISIIKSINSGSRDKYNPIWIDYNTFINTIN